MKVQLPDASLNFEQYTEFQHKGSCHEYRIGESYESISDLEKIDSLEVDLDEESDSDSELEEPESDSEDEDVDDDKIGTVDGDDGTPLRKRRRLLKDKLVHDLESLLDIQSYDEFKIPEETKKSTQLLSIRKQRTTLKRP